MRLTSIARLAALTALVSGCGMLQTEPNPFTLGSQWHVVSVDGQSTEGKELILTFIGDSATISSECGATVAEVEVAPEGDAVSFGDVRGPSARPMCSEEAMFLHELAAGALPGVERWARDGDVIELRGGSVIRLESQRTDT